MAITTTRLDNGLRVVTEEMPGARSVTTGFWVGVGACDEAPAEAGASHFLEHLLFKGTEARTAGQIAEAVDAVGGEMNAFTTQEHTAYYTRLPAAELDLGLDIVSDVLLAPAFRPADVEAERQVILEEILMEDDAHDDRVLTLLDDALFPDHPLGREVLGTRQSITAIDQETIRAFHRRWYRPANLVVAAAGALDHQSVVAGVKARFAGVTGGDVPERHGPSSPARSLAVLRRRTEQVHLAVGVRALPRDDDDRYALAVANHVLGGGPSSRLFHTIREERGLAYSVFSHHAAYERTGALVAYAATALARLPEVLRLVHLELDRLLSDGVTDQELRVAAGYLAGSTMLGLEDSGGCMARIGEDLLVHGRVPELDDVVASYRAVTSDDVQRALARTLGASTRSVAVVGPVSRRQLETQLA
ncbi:MAG TPA: pitrilysin family protein [Acidimicrobiales bacterium]|nr:pitrilysin family protein [Acidimicrobiales bacterium]